MTLTDPDRALEISKKRLFWLVLAIIVVAAAIPRLLTYDFSLPYIDHADEPNFYVRALWLRGIGGGFTNEPPVYHLLVAGVQIVAETIFGVTEVGSVIRYVRLVSVLFNLATLVFIALAARRASGNEGGWLAGLLWGIAPLIVQEGVYAMPDPLVFLLVSLALWLAIVALTQYERRGWAIWSVLVGILIILTKYHPPTIIGLGAIVTGVWGLRDWRDNWRLVLIQVVLISGTCIGFYFWIQVVTSDPDILARGREGASVASSGFANLINLQRIWINLRTALDAVNLPLFGVILVIGAAAYIAAWRLKRKRVDLGSTGLSVFVLLTVPWIASAFRAGAPRDVLGGTVGACVIVGVALGQVIKLQPKHWPTWASGVAAAMLAIPIVFVHINGLEKLVKDRLLPDRRVQIREWFDANLDPAPVIVDWWNDKTFNPTYGGIQGQHWFDWFRSDDLMEKSLEDWRNQGDVYAILPEYTVAEMELTPEGRAYLGQMLELRTFDDPAMRAPAMVVYRLWRMDHELDVQFGDYIHLVGFDLEGDQPLAGDTITLRSIGAPLDNPMITTRSSST